MVTSLHTCILGLKKRNSIVSASRIFSSFHALLPGFQLSNNCCVGLLHLVQSILNNFVLPTLRNRCSFILFSKLLKCTLFLVVEKSGNSPAGSSELSIRSEQSSWKRSNSFKYRWNEPPQRENRYFGSSMCTSVYARVLAENNHDLQIIFLEKERSRVFIEMERLISCHRVLFRLQVQN